MEFAFANKAAQLSYHILKTNIVWLCQNNLKELALYPLCD